MKIKKGTILWMSTQKCVKVQKVGRLYLYTDAADPIKIDRKTLKSAYAQYYKRYAEIEEIETRYKVCYQLARAFEGTDKHNYNKSHYSTWQLKAVAAILNLEI